MIDLTSILSTLAVTLISIAGTVFLAWLQSHMKDQAAAATIAAAVKNSLGAIQQAAITGIRAAAPKVTIMGVPAATAQGLQYVLDHAGDEAARLGITQKALVSKIEAQIGLANTASNIATAASPASSPPPLAPVGTVPAAALKTP